MVDKVKDKYKPSKIESDGTLVMSNEAFAVCEMLEILIERIWGMTVALKR